MLEQPSVHKSFYSVVGRVARANFDALDACGVNAQLNKYVNEVGGMGEYGWYMGFKQSMTVGIPGIYREVLEAWRSISPKIDYECKEVETFINVPLFLNEKFKHNNKTLYEPKFMEAGIKQEKDILYEVIPGFLKKSCIYDSVYELEGMESKEKVNIVYERIKASLSAKWVNVIERSCVEKKEQVMPEIYVTEDDIT